MSFDDGEGRSHRFDIARPLEDAPAVRGSPLQARAGSVLLRGAGHDQSIMDGFDRMVLVQPFQLPGFRGLSLANGDRISGLENDQFGRVASSPGEHREGLRRPVQHALAEANLNSHLARVT
jgi:hypothetical protein